MLATSLDAGYRRLQRLGAPLQRLPFVLGHRRLQDLHDTRPPENARHRERDTIRRVIGSNRNHRSLVAQYDLRNASRHDADPELAGLIAFDDRDVGVPDFALDPSTELPTRVNPNVGTKSANGSGGSVTTRMIASGAVLKISGRICLLFRSGRR
jgi:hypothetical protein